MRRVLKAASIVMACLPFILGAQSYGRDVSISGGAMGYDASGTGTAPLIAIRTSSQIVGSWILGELNFGYATLDEQFSDVSTRVGIGEGQVQLQLPSHALRPYLGVGGGWLHYFNHAGGNRPTNPRTYSGSLGLRVAFPSRLMLRTEMRLRGWDSSVNGNGTNSGMEYTAGVGYAF